MKNAQALLNYRKSPQPQIDRPLDMFISTQTPKTFY